MRKGRLTTQDHPPKNPAVLTSCNPRLNPQARLPSASTPPPPVPRRRRGSAAPPGLPRPPRNRSQPPPGSGNPPRPGPARPCPGAQSGPCRPRPPPFLPFPEQPLGPLKGHPRPSSHHLPPGPRFYLTHTHTQSPLRDRPTQTQAEGPPRARAPTPRVGPAPRLRETMNSHNSPAAPELRGSGRRFLSPFFSLLLLLLLRPGAVSGRREPSCPPRPAPFPSLPREPPPPPGRRPRSLPEESHFIPRSNMAAPPAAAAAAAFALPRLPAAEERPQAVLGNRPPGRWRYRERPEMGLTLTWAAGKGTSRAGLRVSSAG